MFAGYSRGLRLGSNGPALYGAEPGQVPVWDGLRWTTGVASSYDYLIRSRADLEAVVAPQGGVFELPAGTSLAVLGTVDLAGDVLQSSGPLSITGIMPGDGFVTAAASPILTIDPAHVVRLQGATFENTAGPGVFSSGTVQAALCTFRSGAASYPFELAAGLWEGQRNTFDGPLFFAARALTGVWREFGSDFASLFTGIDVRVGMTEFTLVGSRVVPGQNGIRIRGARCAVIDCDVAVGIDTAAALVVLDCQETVVAGGVLRGTAAGTDRSGIWLTGAANLGTHQLAGVTFRLLNTAVRHTSSGTVQSFSMADSVCQNDVNLGVQWANGAFPTSGLVLNSCGFLGATAFNGFTAAAAGANVKQCYDSTGLLAETPIL